MTHPLFRRGHLLIALALSAGCSWPAAAAAPTFPPPATPVLGVNKYNLSLQYLGLASGGDGSVSWQRLGRALARKSLDDARYYNFAFLRISATGYGPRHPKDRNDLALWQSDPAKYWQIIDTMMDDVEKRHLQLVVTLNWQSMQFPNIAGETRTDMIARPSSRSFELAARYAREFVQRYRQRRAILFWELTNEMNLSADLDSQQRCERSDVAQASGDEDLYCQANGNYSTDEMLGYMRAMAEVVRAADPTRPISSGFSIPRPNAHALHQSPEWKPQSGRRSQPDNEGQFAQYLKDVHAAVDIFSIHIYDGHNRSQLNRLGDKDLDILNRIQNIAQSTGKQVFLGEFGDPTMDESDTGFNARVLNKLKEQRVSYAAPWILEYRYSMSPNAKRTKADSFTLDPEQHMRTLNRMAQFNAPRRDTAAAPPRVVVTWPLECANVRPGDVVTVTASADASQQPRVELWVNQKLVGQLDQPPYAWKVPEAAQGRYDVVAKVTDSRGQHSEYSTRWQTPRSGACEPFPLQ